MIIVDKIIHKVYILKLNVKIKAKIDKCMNTNSHNSKNIWKIYKNSNKNKNNKK